MKIVGLTSSQDGNHDNSAALLINGKLKYALSEERITRVKHDKSFPINSINEALKINKTKLKEIDYFASASPPTNALKLITSYIDGFKYASSKKIIQWAFSRAFFSILKTEIFNDNENRTKSLSELKVDISKIKYVSHYLAHAETAYRNSGMKDCLVVAWDGYGVEENGVPICGAIYRGSNGVMGKLEEIPVYTSLALYYGAVTVALGFKLNDGEGKTMGLAVYGKKSPAVKKIRELFPYFNGEKWIARENWLEVNGVSRLNYFRYTPTYRYLRYLIEEYGSEQVAFAAQWVLEEQGAKYFKYLTKRYRIKNVALAGGIFLNVKFNMQLLKQSIIDKLFVYPNPGDGGVAVGAAYALQSSLGKPVKTEQMEDTNLGRKYTKKEIKEAFKKFKRKIVFEDHGENISKKAAEAISKGKVIGWFQGRDEWGPRALGNRSVLADPRKIETKDRINDNLKKRDWFMPFAPVIMEEFADQYLKNGYATPFMTLTDDIKKNKAKKIPAAIHIDYTARSQIIKKETNQRYWSVINEFCKMTKVPVLLNTSFNRHGLPIVHTPEEAIEHLLWNAVDELVIDTFLVKRNG